MTSGDDALVVRAAEFLEGRIGFRPEILMTLGSGLAAVADAIEDGSDVAVSDVPGLPVSSVPGHAGRLRVGSLGGRRVLAQMGRAHLYEGHTALDVTRAVRVAAALGCTTFVVTNAAGGLDPSLRPGELVVIEDQINLTGVSPLTGVLRDSAPQFIDLAHAYDPGLREGALAAAQRLGIALRPGVYAGVAGPQYETPAEVAMLRGLGASVVGMSTVLEVIAARAVGMRVLGLTIVTNVHGGRPTEHNEVLAVGEAAGAQLSRLLLEVAAQL